METLGLRYNQIEEILRMFPETFQKLNFTVERESTTEDSTAYPRQAQS